MYKIFFLFVALVILSSSTCEKWEPEESVDLTLQNWEFSTSFLGKNFEGLKSQTSGLGGWVGDYDSTTGKNPVIGRTIEFHQTVADTTWSFKVWLLYPATVHHLDCYYQLSSEHWNHPFGNSLNLIEIAGIDMYRTKLNFCNGPQKTYCEFSFKEVK